MQYQIEFQSDLFPVEKVTTVRSDGRNKYSELYSWVINLLSESSWDCDLLNLKTEFPNIDYDLSCVIATGSGRYIIFCGWHPNYDLIEHVRGVWFIHVKKKKNAFDFLRFKGEDPSQDVLASVLVNALNKFGCSNISILDQVALNNRSKILKNMAANQG